MPAVRFEAFDDPSVLEVAEAPTPAADKRTALVRVMAASIRATSRMSTER
jgi:NADPH:quinone reductase-like Zn-dependent oxidoreductase